MEIVSKESIEINIKDSRCSITKYDSSGEFVGSWFFNKEHITDTERVFVDNIISMTNSMIFGETKKKDE